MSPSASMTKSLTRMTAFWSPRLPAREVASDGIGSTPVVPWSPANGGNRRNLAVGGGCGEGLEFAPLRKLNVDTSLSHRVRTSQHPSPRRERGELGLSEDGAAMASVNRVARRPHRARLPDQPGSYQACSRPT